MEAKFFEKICRKVVTPEIDLFPSRLSHQLKGLFLADQMLLVNDQMPFSKIPSLLKNV